MRLRLILLTAATSSLLATMPAAHATSPGDNGRILFSLQTSGAGFQIFTVLPDGSQRQRLTHGSGEALNADWSPDGSRIVFELDYADHAGIAIMRSDGSALRDLTPTGFQGQPAFTADGRHIVFEKSVDESNDGIWIMRTDGTGQRQLTRNPFPGVGADTDPNVSPDGGVVSFLRVKEFDVLGALFTVRTDGSDLRQLTPYHLEVGVKHDWAPDGSRIALITHADHSPPGTSANVATIRPDGTGLRLLTHYRGGEINALTGSYSPDGRWIVYRLENHGKYSLFKIRTYGVLAQPIRRFILAPRYIDWGTS